MMAELEIEALTADLGRDENPNSLVVAKLPHQTSALVPLGPLGAGRYVTGNPQRRSPPRGSNARPSTAMYLQST